MVAAVNTEFKRSEITRSITRSVGEFGDAGNLGSVAYLLVIQRHVGVDHRGAIHNLKGCRNREVKVQTYEIKVVYMTVENLRILHSLELDSCLVLPLAVVYDLGIADASCLEGIIVECIIPRKVFGIHLTDGDLAAGGEFQGRLTRGSGGVLCPVGDTVLVAQPSTDAGGLAVVRGGSEESTVAGFDENIPRILREGQGIEVQEGSWTILPIFRFLEKYGNIPHREMFNIFNMGVGMVLALDESEAQKAIGLLAAHGDKATVIGRVTDKPGVDIRLL